MEKKIVFLTGFTVFGDYAENPTEKLALALRGKILAAHRIESFIFSPRIFKIPEVYAGELLVDLAYDAKAVVIVSFGLASEVKGLRVESYATNWAENEKYCLPDENRRVIDREMKPKAKLHIDLSRWDIGKMFLKFEQAGIPYESIISRDAGNFCCNALIYRVLTIMKWRKFFLPFLFIHVPCTKAAITNMPDFDKSKILVTEEQLLRAVEIILTCYR